MFYSYDLVAKMLKTIIRINDSLFIAPLPAAAISYCAKLPIVVVLVLFMSWSDLLQGRSFRV
jgi:hypothetical protein